MRKFPVWSTRSSGWEILLMSGPLANSPERCAPKNGPHRPSSFLEKRPKSRLRSWNMGPRFYKTLTRGGMRINISKSGIGTSVGMRGARISVGPRGMYIHLGMGGFRYSRRIDTSSPAYWPWSEAPELHAVSRPAGVGWSTPQVRNLQDPDSKFLAEGLEQAYEFNQKQIRSGQGSVLFLILGLVATAIFGFVVFAVGAANQ